jgi:hypothetical protein
MSKASFRSTTRIECCDAVIRVFDEAGNVLKTHEDAGDFKEWCPRFDPVERACDFAVSVIVRIETPGHEHPTVLQALDNFSRSHRAVIRVYDEAGKMVERHGQAAGDFREFELRTTRA